MPWHSREWTQLSTQLAQDRLPHALLLDGREYIGKMQFALALSRLLLCAQPEGGFNCGKCHACELSAQGNHGDFRWVEPIEKSRTIKIDQIRETVRFTSTTAGFGTRKVIVVAPADRMNTNAFNALLKSLEEPAKNTYLILVSNQLQNIPPTIRSRCHLQRLATPATEPCLNWLDEFTSNPEQSRSLLAIAGGLPLLAHRLYLSGNAEVHITKRLALESLAGRRVNVPDLCLLWSDDEVSVFLEFLAANLQFEIGKLSTEQLRLKPSREKFYLLDEVYQLRRAIIAGANPNKQLLLLGLLSKYQRELGTSSPGDNILTRSGEVGV